LFDLAVNTTFHRLTAECQAGYADDDDKERRNRKMGVVGE
jgi:hypothetical protein